MSVGRGERSRVALDVAGLACSGVLVQFCQQKSLCSLFCLVPEDKRGVDVG